MIDRSLYPARIVVVGCPGAGKTYFSAMLARRIGIRHIERDRLGVPNTQAFRDDVSAAVAGERWVFDGPPYFVEGLVYPAVQAVIWLDYRRSLILARAIRRSLRRMFGPLEPGQTCGYRLQQWLAPGGPRFAMSVYTDRRREFARLRQRPELAGVAFIRFGSPNAAAAWLATLDPRFNTSEH